MSYIDIISKKQL